MVHTVCQRSQGSSQAPAGRGVGRGRAKGQTSGAGKGWGVRERASWGHRTKQVGRRHVEAAFFKPAHGRGDETDPTGRGRAEPLSLSSHTRSLEAWPQGQMLAALTSDLSFPLPPGFCFPGCIRVPALPLPLKPNLGFCPGPPLPPSSLWSKAWGWGLLQGKPGSSWHMCKNSPGRRSSQIDRHSSFWGCPGNGDRQDSASGLSRAKVVNGGTDRLQVSVDKTEEQERKRVKERPGQV